MKKTDKQLEVKINGTLDLGKGPEDLLQLLFAALPEEMKSSHREM